MSVADDLRAAKALIDAPEKWIRNRYFDQQGCYCAMGALATACDMVIESGTTLGPWTERGYAAEAALAIQLPSWVVAVSRFNDAPTNGHADIMALFDRAIAAAEAPNA